ncbi:MAG: GNAT family N-acetyltransferase [Alphaproteobacteria bacterium]|nr:GNAT family N-acetyltransferase [Alphaproteobacteria bacterium]
MRFANYVPICEVKKFLLPRSRNTKGYEIIAAYEQEEVLARIGFRFLTTLAWGKILYIDDLITKEKTRGKGYGKILLDHVIQIARQHWYKEVHLDTGYARHAAQFYVIPAQAGTCWIPLLTGMTMVLPG